MKYTSNNKPLVCMQTQSTCYKGTRKMEVLGVLWHSTGANNPNLRRYVQPSDSGPAEDTYDKAKWLEILGKNNNKNDWNHISVQAGLNCWIGKLADGTVTTVQTMPWDYRPWGCGGGCNSGWIQFEICEDGLTDKDYFNKVYAEACEITAYLCDLYDIDPHGTVTVDGKKIPTILCHADSYKLGMGSNHGDVNHWFPKHGKSMETARDDVAALLKKSGSSTTSATTSTNEVKTYKVVTTINKYVNAADAAAQKNVKGTFAPGTYYVFNYYPNGYNGMYNITTDKTGNAAGSWINPKENVLQESTPAPETKKLYRVRKSKDDAKSQIGAFASLQNAINACQTAGAGYYVFDNDFEIVYSYKAPEPEKPVEEQIPQPEAKPEPIPETEPEPPVVEPTQEPEPEKVVAVYDLDYPEKTKIVDKTLHRLDTDCVKVIKKILSNNSDFDVEIAKAFFKLAPKYGIDPMMAISQSILETGWFKCQGSAVTSDQHNYCGLGVTSTGVKGGSFDTIEDGVTAQLQHLFAYGCADALPAGEAVLDPRFSLVTRGIAPYWQQLAGRWACPGYDNKTYETPLQAMEAGNTYGQKILAIYKALVAVSVSDEELEKYFPTETDTIIKEEPEQKPTPVEPEVAPEPIPEPEGIPDIEDGVDNTTDDEKPMDIMTLIFNCIKNLVITLIKVFTNKGE